MNVCRCGGEFSIIWLCEVAHGRDLSRTTVKIDIQPPIVGVGDHAEKREAIHLAALSAVYQLHEQDLVRKF